MRLLCAILLFGSFPILLVAQKLESFNAVSISVGPQMIASQKDYQVNDTKSSFATSIDIRKFRSISQILGYTFGASLEYHQLNYISSLEETIPVIDEVRYTETSMDSRKEIRIGIPASIDLSLAPRLDISVGAVLSYAVFQKFNTKTTATTYYTKLDNGGYVKVNPPRVSEFNGELSLDKFRLAYFSRMSYRFANRSEKYWSVFLVFNGAILDDGSYLRGRSIGLALGLSKYINN